MPPQIRPISAELQANATNNLNEVPERIEADLEAIKTWIDQQPHLNPRTDDQFLIAFLRGCKYSLERTKAKLDKYYTLRTKYPELFNITNVDDPKLREIQRQGPIVYLPNLLNGVRLGIFRLGVVPAEKYSIGEVMQVGQVMQEIALIEDDYAIINGVIFIMDLNGATASHMFQMTPGLAKKMTAFSEEALPMRPKAQHFVNTITGFETVFNMFKPMMSKKQQGRLFVHSKIDSLVEQVPLEYLPKEYGGQNGSLAEIIAEWDTKFDAYREYFKDNAKYGTDEKLRPGKPIDFDSIFGTEGSFRKLDVD
ncbi:alpha-tocopherol transfer protein-like [Drosophila sulfurigaster albostrigata]|uniref:alpha-tocopherol transfer protein-like n=1 Tax=Drosophila sulfurigaster albostrigata TaxID=89887 RepID=UPI002D21A3EE|nr:alpha-tocopherol transfer protein-like [Drosophila sulfurigaster albostrigata]